MAVQFSRLASRALLALLMVSAVAPAVAKPRPDNLTPSGKAVDCVFIRSIRSTDVRDDRTIDFIMNGGQVYRNTLPYSCPTLGFERKFMYKTSQSELCSIDIVTVLRDTPQLQQGASCGLGKFQPMAKVGK